MRDPDDKHQVYLGGWYLYVDPNLNFRSSRLKSGLFDIRLPW